MSLSMQSAKKSSLVALIGLILLIFLFVFFTYTFFHELGHVIAGFLFGQSLTEFDLSFWDLSAHAGMTGGDLTPAQLATRSAAGTALPFFVWIIFISFVPRRANLALELLKLLASMAVINTLITWIVFPILYLFGKAPSDDVTNFLHYSQMEPLLLTLIAICLYAGGWMIFLSKMQRLQHRVYQFTSTSMQGPLAGTRATIFSMISLLILCTVVTVLFNRSGAKNFLGRYAPPDGFVTVADLDLSKKTYSSEILTQFTLDKPALIGVFVAVHNINTTYIDLRVKGTDGFDSIVLHGEGYNAFQDGGLWEENLPAGTYQLVLASHRSAGQASIYLRNP